MLNLTTEHIEEIRKYFLAASEEDGLIIQKNIKPSYLSSFLSELKHLFNSRVIDENKLKVIASRMGAQDHLKALKEIQHDYYSHLAQLYNSGVINPDIDVLVKVNNSDFLQEVDFQKSLKIAFQLNERATHKKTFQELDKESEISSEEIGLAFKLIERQKLKEQFQQLDRKSELKPPARVIQFNWKSFAIAASIAGALALGGYLYIHKEGRQEERKMAKNMEDEISLFGKENDLIENSKVYQVKEVGGLKYDGLRKADSINVILRDVGAMADLISFKTSFLLNEFDSASATKSAEKNNRHILDSLKSLQEYLHQISDTYSFNAERNIITLNVPSNDTLISVYRYPTSGKHPDIYIKFNSLFYKIDNGIAPMPFKPINDRNLIELLERF